MFSPRHGIQVYVYTVATDMRRSFDSLSCLVESVIEQDPLSGHMFVFFNRRRDYVKVLYWDESGYCLWSKRLEAGTFAVPVVRGEIVSLGRTELSMLLDGIDVVNTKHRKRYKR